MKTSAKQLRLILYFSETGRRPAEKLVLKNFVFVFWAVSQNTSGLSKYEKHKSARDCTSIYADVPILDWNLTIV